MNRYHTDDPAARERGLTAAAAALRRGRLAGIPVDVGYGIAADAFHDRGARALREAKGRADLAIPVMVARISTVAGIALVDGCASRLMVDFWPGPLTVVLRAQPTLAWSLSDRSGRVAVRMPLHPVALELLDRTGPLGVVAGAPTRAGGPVAPDDAFPADLASRLDVLLDAGPLGWAMASAVVDLTGSAPVLVRRGPLDVEHLREACPDLVVPPPVPVGPGA